MNKLFFIFSKYSKNTYNINYETPCYGAQNLVTAMPNILTSYISIQLEFHA